jgi:hypothetical protein
LRRRRKKGEVSGASEFGDGDTFHYTFCLEKAD